MCLHYYFQLQKIEELFLGVDDFYAFSVGYYSPQSSEPTYSTAPNSNNGSALNRTDLDHSGSYAGSYKKNPTTYNSSNVNNKNNNKNNSNNNKKVTGNTTENTPSNTNHAPTSTNQDDGSSRIKKNNAPINPTNRGPRVIPNDQPLYGCKYIVASHFLYFLFCVKEVLKLILWRWCYTMLMGGVTPCLSSLYKLEVKCLVWPVLLLLVPRCN